MENLKSGIQYSQCWEDTELLLCALDIKNTDHVLSITSGGCNTLSLLAENPEKIAAIDLNPSQSALLELKHNAIKHLDYNETLEFLGINKSNNRLSVYRQLQSKLSENAQFFWDNRLHLVKKGIIHSGKFEKYLSFFRNYIHPLIHSKKTITGILQIEDKNIQKEFYSKRWNNARWRWIFVVFFGKLLMRKYGRGKDMFAQSDQSNVGLEYFLRTEKALKEGNVSNNRYLEYMLTGNCKMNLPHYLIKEVFHKIKNADCKLELVTGDILTYLKSIPDNSFTKFNLSDVFEPLSQPATQALFIEIFRVATPGARLIFWNNLVKRDVPEKIRSFFVLESESIEKLKKSDKIFFYANFTLYTIQK